MPRLPGGLGSLAGSMPLGLIRGRPFRPFSRAFSWRSSAISRSCSATLLSSCTTSAFSAASDRPSMSAGTGTSRLNRTTPRRHKQNLNRRPGFCPCYENDAYASDNIGEYHYGDGGDDGDDDLPLPSGPEPPALHD